MQDLMKVLYAVTVLHVVGLLAVLMFDNLKGEY